MEYEEAMFQNGLKYKKVGGKIVILAEREFVLTPERKLEMAREMAEPLRAFYREARRQRAIADRRPIFWPEEPEEEQEINADDSGLNESLRSPALDPRERRANQRRLEEQIMRAPEAVLPIEPDQMIFVAEQDSSLNSTMEDQEEENEMEEDSEDIQMGDIIPSDIESE